MDGPHAARSGHQGTAMSLAPLAHVLFTRVMKKYPPWTSDTTEPAFPALNGEC
ncbi:MAG: hypothetical protein EBY49_11065 [Actinobacteria bacterium]|nr:hypothetical protein [Actinomycetota bacterium]